LQVHFQKYHKVNAENNISALLAQNQCMIPILVVL